MRSFQSENRKRKRRMRVCAYKAEKKKKKSRRRAESEIPTRKKNNKCILKAKLAATRKRRKEEKSPLCVFSMPYCIAPSVSHKRDFSNSSLFSITTLKNPLRSAFTCKYFLLRISRTTRRKNTLLSFFLSCECVCVFMTVR